MPYIGQPPVTGDTTKSFRLLDNLASFTLTFDATSSSVVDTSANTLTFANHRFVTAQRVTYTDGGGTAIGGLTDGTAYFVIKVDQNTIQLASSASNANNSTAISLSSGAAGGSHTLNLAFDGTNTKFKATYGNGTKAKISRAGQLLISINGVLQQAQESSSPTLGFGLDSDSTIVFSQAPVSTDVLFGQILADTITNFDTQDNTLDVFTGDGSTTAFTLSKKPASSNDILVTLDGVVQYPTTTSTSNAYSVSDNTLLFTSAPADGVAIQVRHIGFAGATSSAVTGLYGRTGNVTLSSSDDDITVGNVTAGIITATSYGSISGTTASFSGNVSIGGTLTYEDVTNIDSVGLITARNGIKVDDLGVQVGTGATIDGATNTLTFLTNGSERVRIDSSGNFGLGTTNPSYLVDAHTSSGNAQLRVKSGGDLAQIVLESTDTSGNSQINFADADSSNIGMLQYFHSDNHMEFTVNGSEAARIDSNGRLLLGTTTEGVGQSDDLTVATSGDTGITVRSGTSSNGNLFFSDGTSGTDEYRGYVQYDHSANALIFGSDATERMRIDSSGRLLVGTSSVLLDNTSVNIQATASTGSRIALGRNDTTTGADNIIGGITFRGNDSNGTYQECAYIFANAESAHGDNDKPTYLKFATTADGASSSTERMRLDSSGRLLVGTTSASTLRTNIIPKIQTEATAATENGISLFTNVNASTGPFLIFGKSRGTTAGSNTVVQNNDALATLLFIGADGTDRASMGASIGVAVDGTPGANDMPGRLVFSTTADGASSPTERMRIDSSGTVTLGNSSSTFNILTNLNSAARLHLSGGGSGSANIDLHGSTHASDAKTITFDTNNSERMRIENDGGVIINNANNIGGIMNLKSRATTSFIFEFTHHSNNASVGSVITSTSSTAFNTNSDYRLKENVVNISDGITRVKQLAPKRFNFIADAETTVDGFLAHEAQTVVPEAVTGEHNAVKVWQEGEELPDGVSVGDNKLDEDGNTIPDYQGIDQSKLVPLLTAALQEAITKIETLETQNADLLSRVVALEG